MSTVLLLIAIVAVVTVAAVLRLRQAGRTLTTILDEEEGRRASAERDAGDYEGRHRLSA